MEHTETHELYAAKYGKIVNNKGAFAASTYNELEILKYFQNI